MLAFLKKFSWKFFSMVTTQVVGHEDFLASLKSQERRSRLDSRPNKYGHVGFQYKILSHTVLRSVDEEGKMKQQLYADIDPDTRIFLLHASPREAKSILDMAETMGWTSEGYVWILTATALGDRTEGDSANLYPLGTFAVTYDSQVSDMRAVIQRAIRVWLQAMVDMDRAGQLTAHWPWDTQLACTQHPYRHKHRLQKWRGGELLFQYLRNVSLPETKDEMATEFNDTGRVKLNKLSILNVMREISHRAFPSHTIHKPSWSHGKRRKKRSSKGASSNYQSVHEDVLREGETRIVADGGGRERR
ncbi:hypothetical protein ACOMHN_036826 [Nucella lapillus]